MAITCLIDADVLTYRIGFAVEPKAGDPIEDLEPVSHAFFLLKKNITKILDEVGTKRYRMYLTSTDKSNYRFDIATIKPYKGNRTAPKPIYYDEIRQYLVDKYNAEIISGMEADDAMGIEQMNSGGKSVICTIDKDLLMIPGHHYNFVTGERYHFSDPGELFMANGNKKLLGGGIKWFYAQCLLGDPADNVPGVKGYGPKKVFNLLRDIDDEKELFDLVWSICYDESRNGKCEPHHFLEVADLLWIQRSLGERFTDRAKSIGLYVEG